LCRGRDYSQKGTESKNNNVVLKRKELKTLCAIFYRFVLSVFNVSHTLRAFEKKNFYQLDISMVKAPILLSPADNHYQQPPPLAATTSTRIVHSVGKPPHRKATAFSATKPNRTQMAAEPPGSSSLAKSQASSISICSDTDSGISVATQASSSLLVAGSGGSGTTAIAVVAPTARTIDNMVVNAQPLCIKTGTTASVTPITVAIPTMPPPMPQLNPSQQQHQQQHLRNMLHHHHHMQQHHLNAIPMGSAPPPGTTFIAAQQPPGPTGAPPPPQGFVQPPGGGWPLVEPVFHFGPGFERHQRHFCPTHSAQLHAPSEHVVYFHVYSGVSVTFQDGGNREVVRGEFLKLNASYLSL
jgi:hypothetical protein